MTIHRLENRIMDYDWGSRESIAAVQGRPVPSPGPEAELWIGAHPKAPSLADGVPLDELIAGDPDAVLGPGVGVDGDGRRLPFLLKLLAAARPLSLQTHPDKARAREGFARENAAGIPIDSPQRNYRDANHKPEIVCALGEFWALNGFRSRDEIADLLDRAGLASIAGERARLAEGGEAEAVERLFTAILNLPAERVEALNRELGEAARGALADTPEGPWLSRILELHPTDGGVVAVLLLNLVRLDAGTAMTCDAGRLHAYLGGFCVEVMANSDNVLRGGLTSKHVDVAELLDTMVFEPSPPRIHEPVDGVYASPAEEFEVARIAVAPEAPVHVEAGHGFEILLAVAGEGTVGGVPLTAGQAVAVTADHDAYDLAGRMDLFRVRAL